MESLPSDYAASHQQLSQMRHQFLREISAALQPRLNAHFQQLAQDNLAEKQQIATHVNHDLRLLNLCLQCPVTQSPAILVADCRDADRTSRFRFQSFDSGGRRHRMGVSVHIPELTLAEAPAREESMAMHGSLSRNPGPSSR
jgi:hypothetical protein